jgi:sugar phosphate isomerase/epimerase
MPTRREFLHTTASLAAAAVPSFAHTAHLPIRPSAHPIGIQLYTVRHLLERDFEATLAELAKIGYQEVEFAGLYGHSARDVRALLDRLKLRAPSGHVGLEVLQQDLPRVIAEAKTLGQEYVVFAWIDQALRTADGYAQVAAACNQIGQRLRSAGLGFAYHNYNFEFAPLSTQTRQSAYDFLLSHTDQTLVQMELDLFWIRQGGGDPLRYFAQYPGRFPMVHIKDMAADGSMVDVGAGATDWPSILKRAKQAGMKHYFVEHDEPADPIATARASYQFLHGLSW